MPGETVTSMSCHKTSFWKVSHSATCSVPIFKYRKTWILRKENVLIVRNVRLHNGDRCARIIGILGGEFEPGMTKVRGLRQDEHVLANGEFGSGASTLQGLYK